MNDRLKGRPTHSLRIRGVPAKVFASISDMRFPSRRLKRTQRLDIHARKKIRKGTGREVLKKVNGKHRAFS